jgi:hypothetical protein
LDISPAVLPTWCAVGFPFGGFVICSYSLTGARLVVRYIQLSKKKKTLPANNGNNGNTRTQPNNKKRKKKLTC